MVEATGLDAGGARLAVPTIVLEPSRHLIQQTVEAFNERFPTLQVSGILAPDDRPRSVTVMSYELFVNMLRDGRLLPGDVGAVVMDEAHRGLSDLRQGLIRRFLDHAVVTAFSATPAFDANKNVHALLGAGNEVVNIPDERLRREGIISPVANYVLRVDVAGTMPSEPSLVRAILRKAAHDALISFLVRYEEPATGLRLRDKAYFGYVNGLGKAEEISNALSRAGMSSRSVRGSDGLEGLRAGLDDLKGGRLRALVNDRVLAEGVNLPQARGVVAFDATTSLVKHVQRCGRARRLDPSLDPFDPRQMSSVVEAMICIDGIPLDSQRIYAEAIGDLSIATLYEAPRQDAQALASNLGQADMEAMDVAEEEDDASEIDEAIGRLQEARGAGAGRVKSGNVDEEAWAGVFTVRQSLNDIHYLLAERKSQNRPAELLPRTHVAHAINTTVGNPHLVDIFSELEAALRNGEIPIVGGVVIRAGHYRFRYNNGLYVHVEDVPHIGIEFWRRIGRLPSGTTVDNFGAERTAEWLDRTGVADACNLSAYHPAFTAAWEEALSGQLGEFEDGPLIRLMRDRGRPKLHVHRRGVDAFRARLGVDGPVLPVKGESHASHMQVCKALGVSTNLARVNEPWNSMVDDLTRDGVVVREGRRVELGFFRGGNGKPVPALDRSEIEWFAKLTGVAHLIDRSDEWLTMNEAARAISTSPYATPALKELWQEIRRAHEEGAGTPVAGRTWRGAMAKGTEVGSFRLHVSEVDALAAAIGRGRDRLMTEDWLTAKKVGNILNQSPTRGFFFDTWQDLISQLKAGKIPTLQDRSFRMEERLLTGKWIPCLHVSEVDALGQFTGGRRSSGPKEGDWLGMGDVAEHFGKHQSDPTFRRSWRELVLLASKGPIQDGGRNIRMEYRTATKSIWCLHRDELEWFGKLTWPKRFLQPQQRYVSLALLRSSEPFDGMHEAFDILSEEVCNQINRMTTPSLPGREEIRFRGTSGPNIAIHPEDIPAFLEMVSELSNPQVSLR
jgi:superfamily II DNA or RNA helicase